MKRILLSLIMVFTVTAVAAEPETAKVENTDAEFDSLGGNKIFLEKAKALQPEKNVSIVQNRTVPLERRFEIASEFAGSFGGDTYSRTKTVGVNAYYHITPRWAVGAKFAQAYNSLTPEGEALVEKAYAEYQKNPESPTAGYPVMDYPKTETMAVLNFSPIYGKMNLFDKAVAHFDLYLLGGYGQVELRSGATPTYAAGGGFGFWISKHFSTHLEMRYHNYTAKYFETEKEMDVAVASVQVGWLL